MRSAATRILEKGNIMHTKPVALGSMAGRLGAFVTATDMGTNSPNLCYASHHLGNLSK